MPAHILVVDDEPDLELLIRQKMRRRIRSGEYDFLFANDGVEALDVLAAHPEIDVVLSDINMPRMDGLTLLGRIGALEQALRVVIVSAYGDISNIRTAMNRGAFDFIVKPIDFGDLEITIDKTYREVTALKQAAALQGQLSALQHELDIASEIQRSTLPSTFPAFPERTDFDLYATTLPAREVGGDFYDYFLLDEHRVGFSVGDVSGKGVGAALFMAVTRTLLRATALQGLSPAECVRHVNRVLFPESLARMFVTLIYGELDTRTGEMTYCCAGHSPPMCLRKDGTVDVLARTGGIGVCLVKDFAFQERSATVTPGDTLLFYTDGVSEAVNGTGEQFEDDRLLDCLARTEADTPAATIRAVLHAVEQFVGGTPQADDITVLAVQHLG